MLARPSVREVATNVDLYSKAYQSTGSIASVVSEADEENPLPA